MFPSNLERHVITILVSLMTAGITYIVSEQINNSRASEGTKMQIVFLIQQVSELRADLKKLEGSYVRIEQYIDHETRLRALEHMQNGPAKRGP